MLRSVFIDYEELLYTCPVLAANNVSMPAAEKSSSKLENFDIFEVLDQKVSGLIDASDEVQCDCLGLPILPRVAVFNVGVVGSTIWVVILGDKYGAHALKHRSGLNLLQVTSSSQVAEVHRLLRPAAYAYVLCLGTGERNVSFYLAGPVDGFPGKSEAASGCGSPHAVSAAEAGVHTPRLPLLSAV